MRGILKIFFLTGIIFSLSAGAQIDSTIYLKINPPAKDTLFEKLNLNYKHKFESITALENYLPEYITSLQKSGWIAASIDRFVFTSDTAIADLYLGEPVVFTTILPVNIDEDALQSSGFNRTDLSKKPLNIIAVQSIQKKIVDYYANRGYPFAQVFLDSVQFTGNTLQANLFLKKNYEYLLDSVHIAGNAVLNDAFIYRHLGIEKGMSYNQNLISRADSKMTTLPFISIASPSNVTMLGTGATLNLYLDKKRNNILDFLVGLMPSSGNERRLLFTGDVNIQLNNSFGNAESIIFKWQQLQPKSPRLHLSFDQDYILRSPFGLNLLFDMLKKDSSYFTLTGRTGTNYRLSEREKGKVFFEFQNNSVLNEAIDTAEVKLTGQLPPIIDNRSSAIGFEYFRNSTNQILSPAKGSAIRVAMVTGLKKFRRNNDILKINDPKFDAERLYSSIKPTTYMVRLTIEGAKYFPLNKISVLKAGLQSGLYSSSQIFRNDLFQIGGYKIMRGFNEESIYASLYNVATAEYRLLIDRESYLFAFVDGGLIRRNEMTLDANEKLISTGAGILVRTGNGLINLSIAVGKRAGQPLKLQNASKIHFGYINYF